MTRLTDLPLASFLDALTSPNPTPGGGSALALAGAMGASLLAMVAGMPKTKTGTPEARAALDAARAALVPVRDTLTGLVDRDSAAYDLVVAAFKRPKGTDEEKAARKAAIQDATRVATDVPLETMRACAAALREGAAVAEHGNPSAASDIFSSASRSFARASTARGRTSRSTSAACRTPDWSRNTVRRSPASPTPPACRPAVPSASELTAGPDQRRAGSWCRGIEGRPAFVNTTY